MRKQLALIVAILLLVGIVSPISVDAAAAKINKKTVTLEVGATIKLKVKNASATVTWKSADKRIAKVSSKGTVTAVSAGVTEIIGAVDQKDYVCKVTVVDSESVTAVTATGTMDGVAVYKQCMPGVVSITHVSGGGSGFFVEANKVITNYHVIKDATKLELVDMNDKHYTVIRVLGFDVDKDIAVLETKEKGTVIKRNMHGLTPGERVYTLGCPFGVPFVIAEGLLGKTEWYIDGHKTIMHTAPMSSGNSGGPLVNAFGEVLGINTLSNSGDNAQNLNYAVKIEEIDTIDLKNPMDMEAFKNRFNQPVATKAISKAHVGDYVNFGKYEQNNDLGDGKEDIQWLVLAEKDDYLLIISRFCLDVKCWSSDNKFVTWKQSEHREWLNGDFYSNSFTADERKKIVYANTDDDITSPSSSQGSSGVYDHLFLISKNEVEYYFPDMDQRKAYPSQYCKAIGAGEFGDSECTFWFTRTPSDLEANKYYALGIYGDFTHDNPDGVSVVGRMTTRPAMWIKK